MSRERQALLILRTGGRLRDCGSEKESDGETHYFSQHLFRVSSFLGIDAMTTWNFVDKVQIPILGRGYRSEIGF